MPYLVQPRGRGYAFRIAVPKSLIGRFQTSAGKALDHITEGLGTTDLKTAERLATTRLAHWQIIFDRARAQAPMTLGEIDDAARELYKATLASLDRDAPIMGELIGTEKEWLESLLRIYEGDLTSVRPEVEAVERKLGVTLEGDIRNTLGHALQRAKVAAINGRLKALEGQTSPEPVNFLGGSGIDRVTLQPITLTRRATKGATRGPWALFEMWIEAAKPAASSVNRWRAVFLALQDKFGTSEITEDAAREWSRELITEERSAVTVRDVWINAARTIYTWALDHKHVAANPFRTVKVTVPDRIETRESKAFTDDEIKRILKAARAVEPGSTFEAAKRWCPWLAAYSGARMGELTQLRAEDIAKIDGIWCFKLTPEAGTIKTRKVRTVPLHDDLTAQGFLDFVKKRKGPLFYNIVTKQNATDTTAPRRPRAVKQRERLAAWIRTLGITDAGVSPTHGFRHTFKAIAARSGILEKYSDAITGHAAATVARRYGAPTVLDLAEALKKFPRYRI